MIDAICGGCRISQRDFERGDSYVEQVLELLVMVWSKCTQLKDP